MAGFVCYIALSGVYPENGEKGLRKKRRKAYASAMAGMLIPTFSDISEIHTRSCLLMRRFRRPYIGMKTCLNLTQRANGPIS